MSAAWLSPVSKSNAGGDGFASFAGTPSKFASAASSGKSAFGGSPTIPYSPDPDIPDSDIVIPSAFPVKATTTMTKSLLSPIPIWRLKLSKTGFFFKPFICIY
ncbi:hypothetical protein EV359DRAFT_88114 [Lentinula novae-zelandiae]|nr:hypothetical protein EV359DRAFT_88114 [Lentinula novae-zelandiae]